MKQLRLATAVGCMQQIVNRSPVDAAMKLGSIEDDYKLCTGTKPWSADEKFRIVRIINDICTGTLNSLGLGEIMGVSAEYMAAIINLFVSPCNQMTACCWLGRLQTNEDIGNYTGEPEQTTNIEYVTPRRLFAMVCELYSIDECHEMARQFKKKTSRVLGDYYEKEKQTKKQSSS